MSELLFLDSNHAQLIGETASDMIFTLNFNTGNDMANYALSIQSVIFPNSVYPINANNNKIYWQEDGGGTITSSIPIKNYSATQLATELQTLFNTDTGLGRTYTVSYDTQTKKFTMGESVGIPNTFQFVSGSNNAYDEIGIKADGGAKSTSYQFDYIVDLSGTEYVDIQTDIGTNNYSSNGKSNILDRIPVGTSFGEIVAYQNTTDDFINLNEDSITTLEIRILDDKGNLWALPENSQVAMVFKLKQIF